MSNGITQIPEHQCRELKRLLPRHRKILSLHLQGVPSVEIAKIFNLRTESIRMIVTSPIFQSELARRQSNLEAKEDEAITFHGVVRAREIIDESSEKAATVQASLLDSGSDSIKHSAAKDILNRALGSGETDKVSAVVLEPGAIQLLQLTINEVKEELVAGSRLEATN